nr:unnamed protein product [Spirometra erinaceieuropaei]
MITEDQIGHENLIAIACTYVEALTSQPHKTFDDTSIDVQQFLTVLENIFYDGLRGSSKWRNNDGVWKFMSTVCRPIPHSCIALVDALDNLKSSISKLRALLRLGLQSKRLHLYFDAAINSRDIIRKFYRPSSILFSNELRAVNHAIVRLQNVDFCFDLRSDELNYPGVRTINYRRLFDPLPRCTITRSDTAVIATASTASPTIDYSVGSPGADRFRYLESKLDSTIQQRNQLQAALTESYKHISRVKADLSRTTHENHVLRTAFDQLQQKL